MSGTWMRSPSHLRNAHCHLDGWKSLGKRMLADPPWTPSARTSPLSNAQPPGSTSLPSSGSSRSSSSLWPVFTSSWPGICWRWKLTSSMPWCARCPNWSSAWSSCRWLPLRQTSSRSWTRPLIGVVPGHLSNHIRNFSHKATWSKT